MEYYTNSKKLAKKFGLAAKKVLKKEGFSITYGKPRITVLGRGRTEDGADCIRIKI